MAFTLVAISLASGNFAIILKIVSWAKNTESRHTESFLLTATCEEKGATVL